MAITFRIWVRGLTLLYTEGDRVHAFMPTTGSGSFGNVPDHSCTLRVPAQYRTDGVNAPLKCKLDGRHLRLQSGTGDTGKLLQELQAQLPDLYPVTQDDVSPNLLDSDANGALHTRVTAPAGDLFDTEYENLFRWRNDDLIPIPYISGVAVPDVDNPVLEILSLDDKTSYERIVLKPDDNRSIEICVSHLPAQPMQGPNPKPGERSPHFIALYGLYCSPADTLVPRFERHVKGSSLPKACGQLTIEGDPFTCVHAFASQ